MSRAFKESEHPRDPRTGRFVRRGGGIVTVVIVAVLVYMIGGGASAASYPETWSGGGLHFHRQAHRDGWTCTTHAHGRVGHYLRQHPCVRMYRVEYSVTDSRGHAARVAIDSIVMPTTEQAAHLSHMLRHAGPNALDMIGTTHPDGNHRAYRQDADTVTTAEAWSSHRHPTPSPLLDNAARTAVNRR